MTSTDYKAAYERQKQARAIAEDLLENRSRELYEANKSLQYAYNKLRDQKEKIIHQEKLASLGQLSAGVAHEINNPAGYIKSNLNTLKGYGKELIDFFDELKKILQSDPSSVSVQENINKIKLLYTDFEIDYLLQDISSIADESREGISRIEDIVKGLRDFSRPDEMKPEIINVIHCIENTLDLVKTQIRDSLKVCCDFSDPLYINGQKGSLSQVFLNLIVNASHAVGSAGQLTKGRLTIMAKKYKNYAMISFEDNGCGMSEEISRKIFEPFFTTKKNGDGTGLGLSISHGIIKKHGGLLSVKSQEGVGTSFIIQLPLSDPGEND